jgi:hypothetical protein
MASVAVALLATLLLTTGRPGTASSGNDTLRPEQTTFAKLLLLLLGRSHAVRTSAGAAVIHDQQQQQQL